jgi:OHCU decarboxylase
LDCDSRTSANTVITLTQLNRSTPEEFVQSLSGIFEHSPWVAQRAVAHRPFSSRLRLLEAMREQVQQAAPAEQLALINAHPKLGARGRTRQQLTQASSSEQRRAGLDACSDEEFARLERINSTYLSTFGFPFVLAVRGHDPASILAQMQTRTGHERVRELHTALQQVGLIAAYRLADVVASDAEVEAQAMLERLPLTDASELVREWMRSANLDVWSDGDHMVGRLTTASADASTLIIGAHYDPAALTLQYDGRAGWVCGLAVIQQLREQRLAAPVNLAVFARPNARSAVSFASLAALDPRRDCIRAPDIDENWADGEAIIALLRRAGVAQPVFAVASREAPEEPPVPCVAATRALQQFLLHTAIS